MVHVPVIMEVDTAHGMLHYIKGSACYQRGRSGFWLMQMQGVAATMSRRSGCTPVAPENATSLSLALSYVGLLLSTQLTCHLYCASSSLLCTHKFSCPSACLCLQGAIRSIWPHAACYMLGPGHNVLHLLQQVNKQVPVGPHVLCIPWSA